jgi:hypothetical protein
MRQRVLPKPTPKGCPECGAQETRGTTLHRPTCPKRLATGGIVTREQAQEIAGSALTDYFPGTVGSFGLRAAPPPEIHILDADGLCKSCGRTFTLVLSPPISSPPAELGHKGGQSRASRLSPEQRSESARKAAKARWGKADA